jgi:hypothetical protein
MKRAAVSSWICKPAGAANPASPASARTGEKHRAPGKSAQPTFRASLRAAFLLGTFLWRGKEKYLDLQVETGFGKREKPDNGFAGKTL